MLVLYYLVIIANALPFKQYSNGAVVESESDNYFFIKKWVV